jgi:hypothetical protein
LEVVLPLVHPIEQLTEQLFVMLLSCLANLLRHFHDIHVCRLHLAEPFWSVLLSLSGGAARGRLVGCQLPLNYPVNPDLATGVVACALVAGHMCLFAIVEIASTAAVIAYFHVAIPVVLIAPGFSNHGPELREVWKFGLLSRGHVDRPDLACTAEMRACGFVAGAM